MPKRAISVTLAADNVTWLKGRAGAAGDTVSHLLDQIVTAARQGGAAGLVRSVVGTIEIGSADPTLDGADDVVRSLFDASLRRPIVAQESRTQYGRSGSRSPRTRRGRS